MKGFGIYVKNNLLEPKHIENMGEAVWLYLWLLDKMTSVSEAGIGKVLGNMPVTYALINEELGLTERTYQRWIARLRDTGYIRTLKTPYGLIITVTKAEKIFKSNRPAKSGGTKEITDPPKVAGPNTQSRQKRRVSPAKFVASPATNGGANKTIQDNTVDNTITTNVVEPTAPVVHGKPEINEMFSYWSAQVGYDIEARKQANRNACNNLLKKYGAEKLKRLIEGVSMAQNDRYAPNIADFSELQQKTNTLIAWGKKKHGIGPRGGVKI